MWQYGGDVRMNAWDPTKKRKDAMQSSHDRPDHPAGASRDRPKYSKQTVESMLRLRSDLVSRTATPSERKVGKATLFTLLIGIPLISTVSLVWTKSGNLDWVDVAMIAAPWLVSSLGF